MLMKTRVTDLFLYRWRYRIGYIIVTLVFMAVIGIIATTVPGGLREAESQSAVDSGVFTLKALTPSMVVDWPYHMLQRASFMVFGITQFSIKLPSLILGLLTAIGIFILIRAWFRRNIAIVVSVISVTMMPFLFMIQDGTPTIMFSFLTIWLLVAGTFVTRGSIFGTLWKVVGCVLLALSLYIPLGIYLTLALIITAALHPHIRYVIRKITKPRLVLAILLGVASIMPLAYAIYIEPTVANRLLGIPTTSIDLGSNIMRVGQSLFGFFSTSNSFIVRPLFSIATTLLMIIGIYKLLTVKYTARSYLVLILGAILSVIVVINPRYVFDLFPLAVLMVAMGIATLIIDWYKLFPRNPYARFAGLIPLAVLVAGLVFSGATHYTNNYLYNPNVLASYNYDLKILDRALDERPNDEKVRLVVSEEEFNLYNLVAQYDAQLSVTKSLDSPSPTTIVTKSVYAAQKPLWELQQIITNKKASDADRFYLYKTTTE